MGGAKKGACPVTAPPPLLLERLWMEPMWWAEPKGEWAGPKGWAEPKGELEHTGGWVEPIGWVEPMRVGGA